MLRTTLRTTDGAFLAEVDLPEGPFPEVLLWQGRAFVPRPYETYPPTYREATAYHAGPAPGPGMVLPTPDPAPALAPAALAQLTAIAHAAEGLCQVWGRPPAPISARALWVAVQEWRRSEGR